MACGGRGLERRHPNGARPAPVWAQSATARRHARGAGRGAAGIPSRGRALTCVNGRPMTKQQDDVVARVLSRVLPSESSGAGPAAPSRRASSDEAADGRTGDDRAGYDEAGYDGAGYDGDQQDLADRQALRRVAGLSTELADVTEVEYRQLRLERVVLAGVWRRRTPTTPRTPCASWPRSPRRRGRRCWTASLQRREQPRPGHVPRVRQGRGPARRWWRPPAPTR